ncbi:MAG: exo-alpha-sialidase [Alphaproteobacteria bacterium]|nr:exo-alpha-sialidase [Alphaproteobacteria bacterium]
MSARLVVGTRKGLFEFRPRGAAWEIAARAFPGEPVSMVLPDPRDGSLYAALALGHFGVKLHRADTGGAWQEVAAPAYPKTADAQAASVHLLWSLESAGADRPGALWAGTIPGGLFHSRDRGESWTLVESLWDRAERREWVGGGYDQPGIHSICVDPRDSRRLLVGVSTGGIWLSDDAGATWRLHGRGMHAEYMPPERADDPLVQDVHRVEQCPAAPDTLWVQHHNGVFRSSDRAASWSTITAIRPAKFGFALAVHPRDPRTAWFVPAVKDECRIPVDGALVVARTRDGGESFDVLRAGLPQRDAFDLVYRHGLAVDNTGTCLAMGSTTGHLWMSQDAGEHWQLVAGNLPPIACLRFA